jgi:hypothetical protein
MFENKVVRRTFGPKKDGENGECFTVGGFIICTYSQISLSRSNGE